MKHAHRILPTMVLTVVFFAAGCGASTPNGAATSAAPAGDSPAAVTPSPTAGASTAGTASPSSSAKPFVVPAGAAYDETIGGRYQLVTWSLGADGSSARLLLVAAPDAAVGRVRTQSVIGTASFDLLMRDTRIHFPTPKRVAASGGRLIRRGALVFPPDDALIALRLTLAPGVTVKHATVVSGPASGRFFLVTVKLKE